MELWVLQANSTTPVWCVAVTVDDASPSTAPSTLNICELVGLYRGSAGSHVGVILGATVGKLAYPF